MRPTASSQAPRRPDGRRSSARERRPTADRYCWPSHTTANGEIEADAVGGGGALPRRVEAVADAADRDKVQGVVGIGLDLRAQPPDMDVHHTTVRRPVRAPHEAQEVRTAASPAPGSRREVGATHILGRRWTCSSSRHRAWASRSRTRSSVTGSAVSWVRPAPARASSQARRPASSVAGPPSKASIEPEASASSRPAPPASGGARWTARIPGRRRRSRATASGSRRRRAARRRRRYVAACDSWRRNSSTSLVMATSAPCARADMSNARSSPARMSRRGRERRAAGGIAPGERGPVIGQADHSRGCCSRINDSLGSG